MQDWVIPPEANGACVAGLEPGLETYAQPDDSRLPVVCMDEQPGPWLPETRVPIAATTHQARRVDDEYERAGTASGFMGAEPLQGWRHGRVRAQRTTVDWALEREARLRTRDAEAQPGLVVCDHFNTHTLGACDEALAAARARQRVRRLALRYTPKHGSGLNLAANERRALTRHCWHDRRCGETKPRAEDTAAGSTSSHAKPRGVDWQFKINDARTTLKSLYPNVKD